MNAKRFSQVMRDLAKIPSQVSKVIAEDLKKEIEKNMDRSVDPYGHPWPRRADGSASVLKKTGAGRASIKVVPTARAGIKITIGLLYMAYHQFGGPSHLRGPGGSYRLRHKNKNFGRDKDESAGRGHPPQRMFIPKDKLPNGWGELILSRFEQAVRKSVPRG